MAQEFKQHLRRYYLLKRWDARAQQSALEPFWHGKQLAEAGTPLPASFPAIAKLALAAYTTVEDLDGADEDELVVNACLTLHEAQAVMRALCALLA